MKKKIWTVSPFLYIITGLMVIMAAVSWFWDPLIFYVEIGVAAAAVCTVILSTIWFNFHIRSAIVGAKRVLEGDELAELNSFGMPVIIVGKKGDIIWANEAAETIADGNEYRGMSISSLIGKVKIEDLINSSMDIEIGDRDFTIYGCDNGSGTILYFDENTRYKDMEREYTETRPVVMMVSFDNKDELSRDTDGGEDTRILGQIESTINDWAYSLGGIYKKLSGSNRYLVLTDEKNFSKEKEKNFPLLDEIHKIKTSTNRSATISVGVGRGATNYAESEKWARLSLEMALGRGGDQVAIKQPSDSYEFFGGLSGGLEKRDKSRTRVIAAAISDQMKSSDMVLVMGHKYSDLDSVGSAVGMWSAARRGMNKQAYIVIDKNQTLSHALIELVEENVEGQDMPVFITPEQALEIMTPKTLLIITDTHSQDYVESTEVLQKAKRVIVIDHHRLVVRHIQNAAIFYHEPYASSASEMVAELVQFIGRNFLVKIEAEALLSGIMLDTKGFIVRCGVRTFEAAAYLRRRGASTVDAKRLFSGSIDDYKAKFQLVSSAEVHGNCAIACAAENTRIPNIRVVSSQAADELLSIQSVMASFVLYGGNGAISVSARSLGDVNVQILMEELGGGGHLTMAGAQIPNVTMEEAKATLLKVLQTTLPKATKFQN